MSVQQQQPLNHHCPLQAAAAPLTSTCLTATGLALTTPCLLAASASASATAQVSHKGETEIFPQEPLGLLAGWAFMRAFVGTCHLCVCGFCGVTPFCLPTGPLELAGFAEAVCTPHGWKHAGACYKLAGEGCQCSFLECRSLLFQ